jgi:hypothetical protein
VGASLITLACALLLGEQAAEKAVATEDRML